MATSLLPQGTGLIHVPEFSLKPENTDWANSGESVTYVHIVEQ